LTLYEFEDEKKPKTGGTRSARTARLRYEPDANQMAARTPSLRGAMTAVRGEGARERAIRFLCSFQTLLRSSRLYQKNHPRVLEALEVAAQYLREALERLPAVAVRVEGRALWAAWPEAAWATESEPPRELENPRGELGGLAEELRRCGVRSISFQSETHIGELDTLVRLLNDGAVRKRTTQKGESDWAESLKERGIIGIRINQPSDGTPRKDETILASLVAAVLALGSEPAATGATKPSETEDRQQLAGVLRLLEKLAQGSAGGRSAPQDVARVFHAILSETEAGTASRLVSVLSEHLPQENESPESFLTRLADAVVLGFATQEFRAGRLAAPALSGFFVCLGNEYALPLGNGLPLRGPGAPAAAWSNEGYAEHLHARFWAELPALTTSVVLRGGDAWCVPIETIRSFLRPGVEVSNEESRAAAVPCGTREEARELLVTYARCLEPEDNQARNTVAAGLAELADILEGLWPHPEASAREGGFPREIIDLLCRALSREDDARTAGLLAAALERVARAAFAGRDYLAFERILDALDAIGEGYRTRWGDDEAAEANVEMAEDLARRLVADERWLGLVDAAVFGPAQGKRTHASAQAEVLPRLLRRDPGRLVDRLGLLLTTPTGSDALPAMAVLLQTIGRPAIELLVARLGEPRRHRSATAIKLLAAATPERLVAVLPRFIPQWDWGLQDLAVSALMRPSNNASVAGAAGAFLTTLKLAHPLVAPIMVDHIGLAASSTDPELNEAAASVLMELARGGGQEVAPGTPAGHEKDVYLRIKAVEALGRMRWKEAVELLQEIVNRRQGLTHAEPMGLRAAAEEALALIGNHPASARIRTVQENLATTNLAFARPRRYLRIPLSAPLEAKILRPEPLRHASEPGMAAARVRTISLGGAFVESERRLAVGDSIHVEIRTGLRRIEGTAVVRNVTPGGNGIEFVHMEEGDRERLRRFVRRHFQS